MAKKTDTHKVLAAPASTSGRGAVERLPQVPGAMLQQAPAAGQEPSPAMAEPLPASRDAGRRWPPVDEYLDEPDEVHRWERISEVRQEAMPATADHGDPHFELDALLAAHLAADYAGSVDLKTRVSRKQEYASDTCVRRAGIDPATGSRYLEELVVEVVHKRSAKETRARARGFAARGVRRQIGIFVRDKTVREWLAEKNDWGEPQDLRRSLRDPCLAVPMPLAALFDSALAKVAIARALEAKGDPVILEIKEKSEARGEARGVLAMRKSIVRVLDRRLESVPAFVRQRLEEIRSLERLEEILDQALTASSVDELALDCEPSS